MKTKGFTLLELLAVIVILAVIALIGTPIIVGIIEDAKLSAFKDSVSNVVSTVDIYTETTGADIKDGYSVLDMDLRNSDLKYGKVKLVNNELIAIHISNGQYCAEGSLGNLTITEGECDTTVPVQPDIDLPVDFSSSVTYTINEVEETETGIDHYEYYLAPNNDIPDKSVEPTGTSDTSNVEITADTPKVCFRIISKSQKVSNWSCVDNYVDTTPPEIIITEDNVEVSKYVISDKSLAGYTITISTSEPAAWNDEVLGTSLYNGSYTATSNRTYYVHAIDKAGNKSYQSFVGRVKYREPVLNGATPVLGDNMIPVTIADNGTVTYADLYSDWYSYTAKEWANAVILNDGYSYSTGDTIPEDAIESYFVWIPRYRYQLFNTSLYNSSPDGVAPDNTRTINIVFGSKTNEPTQSGTTVNSWLTHPSFTSFDSNGFWVGKFETGFRGESDFGHDAVDVTKVVIKPSYTPWTGITASKAFITSHDYLRSNDSHMMKNMEWGATAYLSQTIYGKNAEIWNNPYTNKTGCAGTTASPAGLTSSVCAYYYNSSNGYQTTTTGNITGIYDMAASNFEYMAAYASNTQAFWYTSGSITSYDGKYLDVYPATSGYNDYVGRKLGDATGELGSFYYDSNNYFTHSGWYHETARFPNGGSSWFARGGGASDDIFAGIFSFTQKSGDNGGGISYRIVLTPQ